jgi:hypothetical protein
MKMLAIKTLVSAVAFAALITAPALARSPRGPAAEGGYGTHYDRHVTRDPNDVVVRGNVVGPTTATTESIPWERPW